MGPASERIAFLDSLRATAIIMVVGVHTFAYCVELPQGLKQIVSFIVHTASVPVFFLVDGYLFARSDLELKSYRYLTYVRKSLFRLLVPWAVFTLLYTLARYAFELNGFLKVKTIVGHSWQEVAISAYGSVYAPQMYFLFSLFLIRLCSPLCKQLLFHKNYVVMLFLFIFYYAAYRLIIPFLSPSLTIKGGQEPLLHALWGMQFYLAGIMVFITSRIVDLRKLFLPFLGSLSVSLLIQNTITWSGLSYLIEYLYILTLVLFFAFLPARVSFLDWMGRNTMGIYLVHTPIVLKGVSLVLNRFLFHPLMAFVSILIGAIVVSAGIVMIINAVPYGCLLFGTPYQQKDKVNSPLV